MIMDVSSKNIKSRNSQIDHLCQFTDEIQDEKQLRTLWEMASFKILELYADIEIKSTCEVDKINRKRMNEFKEELAKYILIIDAIKRTLANRKDQ